MTHGNKAQQASRESIKNIMTNNRDGWLAIFAEEAVLFDPAGFTYLNSAETGSKGKKAIAEFYDDLISQVGTITMEILHSHPAGDECANVVQLTNDMGSDMVIKTNMVAVYKVNDKGKVVSLKVYWDGKTEDSMDGGVTFIDSNS